MKELSRLLELEHSRSTQEWNFFSLLLTTTVKCSNSKYDQKLKVNLSIFSRKDEI